MGGMNRMGGGMNNGMNNGMGGGMNNRMGMNNGMGIKSRLGMRGGMGNYNGGSAGPNKFAGGPGAKGFRGASRNEKEGKAKGTNNRLKGAGAKKPMNKSKDKTVDKKDKKRTRKQKPPAPLTEVSATGPPKGTWSI